MKVHGRRVDLSDGRIVFVGSSDEKPDSVFVGFRNDTGQDKKIILTKEAAEALGKMLTQPSFGDVCGDFPHKDTWQLVKNPDFFQDKKEV